MPSVLIDTENVLRLNEVLKFVRGMRWEDLEEFARLIEDERRGLKKESRKKVTGSIVFNATGNATGGSL